MANLQGKGQLEHNKKKSKTRDAMEYPGDWAVVGASRAIIFAILKLEELRNRCSNHVHKLLQ